MVQIHGICRLFVQICFTCSFCSWNGPDLVGRIEIEREEFTELNPCPAYQTPSVVYSIAHAPISYGPPNTRLISSLHLLKQATLAQDTSGDAG